MDYSWPRIKMDVAKYVEKCITCIKAKKEHQMLNVKLQHLEITLWKWDHITKDFITKLI